MAAVTLQRRIEFNGAYEGVPGIAKIVQGTKYMRGWVMVGHYDPANLSDRMMRYPTSGFDSASSLAAGGPMAVAGADANGGFRVIAKEPNVKLQIANGATTSVTVTQSTTFKVILLTADVATVTAAVALQALLGNAQARELIDAHYTGTGAGLIAVFDATQAPFVRMLGVAAGEFDASDAVADTALDKFAHYAQIMSGSVGLLPDATSPPTAGQVAWISDNATVTADWAPLLLPVYVDKVSGGLAFCRLPAMRSA